MLQELHILVGLPGCGKTTFAKSLRQHHTHAYPNPVKVIHCDNGLPANLKLNQFKYVVLDGIFVTLQDIKDGIFYITNHEKVKKIIIHRWKDDLDACLWNDVGRRNTSSAVTIAKLGIVNPTEQDFESLNIPIEILHHEVIRKPECLQIPHLEDTEVFDNRYIRSEEWTVSGQYHSWNGSTGFFSSDEAVDFDDFDDLLMKIDHRFPFLAYKKIRKACVTEEETHHNDYYSDTTAHYWQCDLEKLHKMLKEMGFIK